MTSVLESLNAALHRAMQADMQGMWIMLGIILAGVAKITFGSSVWTS